MQVEEQTTSVCSICFHEKEQILVGRNVTRDVIRHIGVIQKKNTSHWDGSRAVELTAAQRNRLRTALQKEFACKFENEDFENLNSVQDWVNLVIRSMTTV